MSRTVVVVGAALVGIAAAGLLLGVVVPAAGGQAGPEVAWGAALGCVALAVTIGMALTRTRQGPRD